jgi:hypothetical protein
LNGVLMFRQKPPMKSTVHVEQNGASGMNLDKTCVFIEPRR